MPKSGIFVDNDTLLVVSQVGDRHGVLFCWEARMAESPGRLAKTCAERMSSRAARYNPSLKAQPGSSIVGRIEAKYWGKSMESGCAALQPTAEIRHSPIWEHLTTCFHSLKSVKIHPGMDQQPICKSCNHQEFVNVAIQASQSQNVH